jgi:hypothetical protein
VVEDEVLPEVKDEMAPMQELLSLVFKGFMSTRKIGPIGLTACCIFSLNMGILLMR